MSARVSGKMVCAEQVVAKTALMSAAVSKEGLSRMKGSDG
jgi:hypothetical protein